jgi:putative oxidoreductase
MKNLIKTIYQAWQSVAFGLDKLLPLVDLAARIYIGKIFFMSGLNKVQDWETTLYLFNNEYQVPLLSPDIAAVMGAAGELVLPILLVLGLFTRFSAVGLFVLNIFAVIAYYPTLITFPAAIQDHIEWGILLAILMANPVHQFTLDYLLQRTGMHNAVLGNIEYKTA